MPLYYNNTQRHYVADTNYEKYVMKRDMKPYYRYYNLKTKRSQFKKIILVIFCICLFSYFFVDYNLKTKILRLRDRFDLIPRIDAKYNISQAYFIDTPGCRSPYFEVTDDNIIQFISKPKKYTCRKELTRTRVGSTGPELLIDASEILERYNVSDLRAVRCTYTPIKRKDDQANIYLTDVEFNINDSVVFIRPDIEYMRVECFSKNNSFYKDYHFFAIEKPTTIETMDYQHQHQHHHVKPTVVATTNSGNSGATSTRAGDDFDENQQERVSVMLLGIDSVSHLNFLRQMRRTAAYIHQNLSHVEFWGFNKVGDNTYPNLVPLLSGLDITELNISCLAPLVKPTYDHCSFIWKRYKEAGFRTAFAEDVAWMGLFNYCRPGFKRQPTDYYLRPIMLEMEQNIAYKRVFNVDLCMGGRRTADVVLEFIENLVPRLQAEHFFSFFWTATLTHDSFNSPALLDDAIRRLLITFEHAGIFNRTLIFLMSDHGLRFGSFRNTYQGMMEERQPLLMALYPSWLKQKYPDAIHNMELNAKRLTTPYDLHATLMDLLDLRNLRAMNLQTRSAELNDVDGTMPRSISLFQEISEQRTCEQAAISAHWCTCHQREEMATNDARVQRAARYIVHLINERLKPHPQCRTLYLNSILQAFIAAPHNKIVKDVTNDYAVDITLRLQTKPGLAVFETTVRMWGSYSTALTGTISRINLYGSQSYCINDYTLKMFCYCHR